MEHPSLNGVALLDEKECEKAVAQHVDEHAFVVPDNVVIFAARDGDEDAAIALGDLPVAPKLITVANGRGYYALALDKSVQLERWKGKLSLHIFTPGDVIADEPSDLSAKMQDVVGCLGMLDTDPNFSVKPTILDGFSLLGHASEVEANAQPAEPLLGGLCAKGQATVLYAPPNSGKTLLVSALLLDAVHEKRVVPADIYYLNADDSSDGLGVKARLFEDAGINMLAPGYKGFENDKFLPSMEEMVKRNEARGKVVIIDTAKKLVDMMIKSDSARFGEVCRRFVLAGGTVVALAHTNKNTNTQGKLVYTGTSDIIQDFDAGYILTPMQVDMKNQTRVVVADAEKRRGAGPLKVAYRYSVEEGLDYAALLASVEEVDELALDGVLHKAAEAEASDIISAVKAAIEAGKANKMEIVHTVAKQGNASKRAVIEVLKAFTGNDPALHHWSYSVQARGAHVYRILDGRREALG